MSGGQSHDKKTLEWDRWSGWTDRQTVLRTVPDRKRQNFQRQFQTVSSSSSFISFQRRQSSVQGSSSSSSRKGNQFQRQFQDRPEGTSQTIPSPIPAATTRSAYLPARCLMLQHSAHNTRNLSIPPPAIPPLYRAFNAGWFLPTHAADTFPITLPLLSLSTPCPFQRSFHPRVYSG